MIEHVIFVMYCPLTETMDTKRGPKINPMGVWNICVPQYVEIMHELNQFQGVFVIARFK